MPSAPPPPDLPADLTQASSAQLLAARERYTGDRDRYASVLAGLGTGRLRGAERDRRRRIAEYLAEIEQDLATIVEALDRRSRSEAGAE